MDESSESMPINDISETNTGVATTPEVRSERSELGQAALREYDEMLKDRDSVRRGDIEYADSVGLQLGYVEREVLDDNQLSTDPRVRDNEDRLHRIKGILQEISGQSIDAKHNYVSEEARTKIEDTLGKLNETPEGSNEALSLGQEAVGLFMKIADNCENERKDQNDGRSAVVGESEDAFLSLVPTVDLPNSMERYGSTITNLKIVAKEEDDKQRAVENNYMSELDNRRAVFTGIVDKMVGKEKGEDGLTPQAT